MKEKHHFTLLPTLRVLNIKKKQANPPYCSGLSGSGRMKVRKETRAPISHPPQPQSLTLVGAFIICSLSNDKVAGTMFLNPDPSSKGFLWHCGAEPNGSLVFPHGESSIPGPITWARFVFFSLSPTNELLVCWDCFFFFYLHILCVWLACRDLYSF